MRSLLLPVLAAASISLTLGPSLAAASGGDPGTRFVRLPAESAAAFRETGIAARRVLDYGTFLWVEMTSADLAGVKAAGVPVEPEGESFRLRLGERTFDPLAGVPAAPAGLEPRAAGADLQLVQLIGPARQSWLDRLEGAGLRVLQYVHPYTFIVWGDLAGARLPEVSATEDGGFVRWAGPFSPAYRLQPRFRSLAAGPIAIKVLMVRAAGTEGVVSRLAALGAALQSRSVIDGRFEVAAVTLAGERLAEAARIPGVYSVQVQPTNGGLRGEMSNQVNAGNYNGSNLAFPGYQAWLASVGATGAGVLIADVDGGVQANHPDLVNRFLPCTGSTCSTGNDSHGTHTAGIMAADGSSGTLDANGFLRGLGVAPGANLIEQVYFPTFTQAGGMLTLMRQSYANGAELSGNSWGPSGSPEGYDNDTMQVDLGVRDADNAASGNQPFHYVLSFMNGGGGVSSQGTPDEGKNMFTIGSTKMQTTGGAQILQIDDVSSNSAHGPALDGRTIPHMVAPGCSVDSTVPTNSYSRMCGTSMASPHVAGAVALFIERYRNLFAVDPSPAMAKAAFLPVTHDLAGHLDADNGTLGHPFDNKQGWGRMDLARVLDPQDAVAYFDNPQVFDGSGEEWSETLTVDNTSEPVRLMLVWTDAAGHGLGGSTPAWNNNLDLVVNVGADTYRGNVFDGNGLSSTGGSADTRNNTEGVFLPAGTTSFTVRVQATNVSSDGLPGVGDATDQDFALVCYNCLGLTSIFTDGFESGDTSAWTLVVP